MAPGSLWLQEEPHCHAILRLDSSALRPWNVPDMGPKANCQRAYLRLMLDKVVVGKDAIRISGPKSVLAHQLTAEKPLPPASGDAMCSIWSRPPQVLVRLLTECVKPTVLQRLPRSGLSVTFQIRSQPCAAVSTPAS
jgi:hypothetical protein